jgi:hypothetical protein
MMRAKFNSHTSTEIILCPVSCVRRSRMATRCAFPHVCLKNRVCFPFFSSSLQTNPGVSRIKSAKTAVFYMGVSLQEWENRKNGKLKRPRASQQAHESPAQINGTSSTSTASRPRDPAYEAPLLCHDSAAPVNNILLRYARVRGALGMNRDKYASSALLLKMPRGLPSGGERVAEVGRGRTSGADMG